ncbi:hypothetical protein JTE90_017581 [Oedothorax gibbosus]|uniref:Uncharacterized protein n=1 Tax=Oedothorax gibbosus TaxID=931172 RepID=A0AAV6TKL1_9ARAC|nr:hypothetical protein JTE90_017581 [Oedothorax gibbosus]
MRVIHGDLHNEAYSVRLSNDLGPEKLHIVLQNFPTTNAMRSFVKAVGQPKTDDEYPDSWLIDIDKVNSGEFVYRWFILATQSHVERVFDIVPRPPLLLGTDIQ